MPDAIETAGRFEDQLAWRPDDRIAVATHQAMRRHWAGGLYKRARAAWDAHAPSVAAGDLAAAMEVAETLPSAREYRFQDRWLQDEMWRIAEVSIDARRAALEAGMAPRPGDLGTLTADADMRYPAYYTATDFHLQNGGIWRDDRGALVYLLGARLVHVGRNDAFQLHDAFAASIGDVAPARVLDLGCGYGKTTFSLKRRWPDAQVIGLDPSVPCLRLARRLATDRGLAIDWQQGLGERLPFDDRSIDLATVTMVLHEAPPPAIRAILREIHRVLRPGGRLAMLENRMVGDPLRDALGAWHSMVIGEPWSVPYRALDICAELRAAGFAAAQSPNWYAPGTTPEMERDTGRMFTAWALTQAVA
jgi:ubiquinone/menaquinone biosynthesis C-methylase UbiE